MGSRPREVEEEEDDDGDEDQGEDEEAGWVSKYSRSCAVLQEHALSMLAVGAAGRQGPNGALSRGCVYGFGCASESGYVSGIFLIVGIWFSELAGASASFFFV